MRRMHDFECGFNIKEVDFLINAVLDGGLGTSILNLLGKDIQLHLHITHPDFQYPLNRRYSHFII